MTSGKTLNKTKTHPFTIGDDPVVQNWLLLQSNRNKAIRVAINLMVELYGMFDVNEVIPNKKPSTGYRPELDMRARAGLLGSANPIDIPQTDNNSVNNTNNNVNNLAGIDSSQLMSMLETLIKEKGNDKSNSKNDITSSPTSDGIEMAIESHDNPELEVESEEEVLEREESNDESDENVDIPEWLSKLK